jgi:hypothetical protein
MASNRNKQATIGALLAGGLLASGAALAQAAPPPASGPTLDVRLRSEYVDDDAFTDSALANTLRIRPGWRIPLGQHWSAFLEVENTSHLGDDRYNSTGNGNTGYPTIADPDNTELNQAWLAWSPKAGTRAVLGRQRLVYDNQRFIGAVGWRQNDQTFDALDLQHRTANGWQLRYSYLDRALRINGSDNPDHNLARWELDAHLFNVAHKLGPGTLTGYLYLIGNDTRPLDSHRDLGLRYALRHEAPQGVGWFANLEYADQSDYADGSDLIDADYNLLEGGLLWKGNTFKAGWEKLGGDGSYGFATPLATLHAFNGWADRFLTTPKVGLQDSYLGWNRKFGAVEAVVVWHDYRSDAGSIDLGSEWNASLGWVPAKHWLLLAKLADYHAGDTGADVLKTWLSVEYTR